MLSSVENKRINLSKQTTAAKKAQFGQYLTPENTAKFMASLFEPSNTSKCHLLDPGAGIGSLSIAFLEKHGSEFEKIKLEAFEIDITLQSELKYVLKKYQKSNSLETRLFASDFIEDAVRRISTKQGVDFTHAILNPPYKKINSNSCERKLLREVGIETVNLYSAFLALVIKLMSPGGQIVAIVPRSFCNGLYYRPFRELLLEYTAIHRMHLFGARNKAFKDDKVLQENIILLLERGGRQSDVTVSFSTDDTFSDIVSLDHSFERIVLLDDSEKYIHVPISDTVNPLDNSPFICYTLKDLGLEVSTGPVVDFRVKEYLLPMPGQNTVPLLYPTHFSFPKIHWPKQNSKKPNAIQLNLETRKSLYPNGFYTVVRRFSSKEEKRRINASIVKPDIFGDADLLGFENHLNVFHNKKIGIPEDLAFGLAVYLNTTMVDEYFRRFNGHTQVNATDLRQMKYPSRSVLVALGKWAIRQGDELSQSTIDQKFRRTIK